MKHFFRTNAKKSLLLILFFLALIPSFGRGLNVCLHSEMDSSLVEDNTPNSDNKGGLLSSLKSQFNEYCKTYKSDPENTLPKMAKVLRQIMSIEKQMGLTNQVQSTWRDLEHVLMLLVSFNYDIYGRQLGALYMNKVFDYENSKNYSEALKAAYKAINNYSFIQRKEDKYSYQLAYAYLNGAYCAERCDSIELAGTFYRKSLQFLKNVDIEYSSDDSHLKLLHSAYIKYAEFMRKQENGIESSMNLFNLAVQLSEKAFATDPTSESAGLFAETWYRGYVMTMKSQLVDEQKRYEQNMDTLLTALNKYPQDERCKRVVFQLGNGSTDASYTITHTLKKK